jgi:LacI family transcriptional regulator
MEKYTIKDISVIAGVSVSTVSRVINKQSNVDPQICQKVNKVMQDFKFHPNSNAQSMRRGFAPTIGLILPNLIDPFFGSIADHVIENSMQQNLNVQVCISKSEGSYDEPSLFKKLAKSSIDGLIYCSVSNVDQVSFDQYFSNTPVVICSRHDLVPGRPHVFFNHRDGGYLATNHLIEMGHKRIAFFVGVYNPQSYNPADLETYIKNPALAGPFSGIDKFIGSRKALEEKNITYYPELVQFIDLGNPYETGNLAMQLLISKTTDFDSVFCSNDISAIGAIHMLNLQHINVPDSVSVIGYDDSILAIISQPQLSTVVQDTKILGYECVRVLSNLIKGEKCSDIQIDVRLIIRQSSCSHISLL